MDSVMSPEVQEMLGLGLQLALLVAGTFLGGKGVNILKENSRRDALQVTIVNGVRWAIANRSKFDTKEEVMEYLRRGAPQALDWAIKQAGRVHVEQMIQQAILNERPTVMAEPNPMGPQPTFGPGMPRR